MDFSQMLARGLGRAVLMLQTHDPAPYREEIWHACTHYAGYDMQMEASRGRYNFDLITQGGDLEWFLPRLYRAFATGDDVEMPSQLVETMGLLAQAGDMRAREMMYAAFAEDAPLFDTRGADDLVALDGLAGYVFVARQWLKYPLPEDDNRAEVWLLDDVEERFGAEAVSAAFVAAAADGAQADADEPGKLLTYLAAVRERCRLWRAERAARPPRALPDYNSVSALLSAPPSTSYRVRLRSAGRRSDKRLRGDLAHALQAEADPARLAGLLHFFSDCPFPLPPQRLLTLARGDDADIALAAQAALSHITHPEVRALALSLLGAGNIWHAVGMLAANPGPGDYVLLGALLHRPWSEHEMHHLGMSIRDYVKVHPSPDAVPVLHRLYEYGPCSFCRSSVVDVWVALAPLPLHIAHEIAWDAEPDVRAYAAPTDGHRRTE